MTKRSLVVIASLVLVIGIAVFFARNDIKQRFFKGSVPTEVTARTGPAAGHQGHDGGGPQPQPRADEEQAATEAPTVEIPVDKQQLMGVKMC